jgi:hypothetical protein
MGVRTSMADLIARVRTMIADPTGSSQTFDDQTIQDYLDRHRTEVRYVELRAAETILAGGTVEYRDYYADYGGWEADEKLYDGTYNELTPTTADRLTGHWMFATSQLPLVYIVGKHYDVYAAAADLLEAWAAKEKLNFDFDSDGQSFKRSQRVAALLQMAREYRHQQRPVSVGMVRTDANR